MSEQNPVETTAAGPNFETIESLLDVTYAWGYEDTRESLRNLYDKAVRNQWNSDTVLPWHIDVDLERPDAPEFMFPLFGSDIYNRMTERERAALRGETKCWTFSQFLHGEQGALLAAAQLVNSVEDIDSKLYGATQVVDEARHVDVYNRYLHGKLGMSYPVNPHLKSLLDMVLKDSRWDMKFLGMQIVVEGLALAAFGMIRCHVEEPLARALTTYVMQDEARHVAYGILALRDYYADMNERDRLEREDFVYEASVLMRDRFMFQEVWEKAGLPVKECIELTSRNQGQQMFRQMLFSKIVPAVKRLGLLSDKTRERFADLGVLKFENTQDPEQEAVLAEATAAGSAEAA